MTSFMDEPPWDGNARKMPLSLCISESFKSRLFLASCSPHIRDATSNKVRVRQLQIGTVVTKSRQCVEREKADTIPGSCLMASVTPTATGHSMLNNLA